MTTNETREELFAALHELCRLVPDLRSGQLFAAVGELCADIPGRGLWEATDAELVEAVWQFRRNYESAAAKSGDLLGAPV